MYYLFGVDMERKNKNFAGKGAKTAMSLVLALSLVPSSALAEIANTQETTQTQEVAATQTSDTTASTSETTAETSAESTANTETTTNQQTSEQTTTPTDRSSRRVARSLSVTSTELWVDGTNGNDANDGSSTNALKTLQKALELCSATPSINTIHLKGNLDLTSTVTIPAGLTLKIADEGATLTGTGNKIDGLVLKSGSTLTGTGTLTMSGFKTALTAQPGSTITDGTYVFKNNAGSSGSRGISLGGTVKGTTNKTALTSLQTIRAIQTSLSPALPLKTLLSTSLHRHVPGMMLAILPSRTLILRLRALVRLSMSTSST